MPGVMGTGEVCPLSFYYPADSDGCLWHESNSWLACLIFGLNLTAVKVCMCGVSESFWLFFVAVQALMRAGLVRLRPSGSGHGLPLC